MQGEEDRSTRAKDCDGSAHIAHAPPVIIRKRDVRPWLAASPLHKSRRSRSDMQPSPLGRLAQRRAASHWLPPARTTAC